LSGKWRPRKTCGNSFRNFSADAGYIVGGRLREWG
jgi:hypothetical protein